MKTLIRARERRGLSQRALAAKAGVSFRGLQMLERNGHNWRVETLERVASALGLPGEGVVMTVNRFLGIPVDSVQEISVRIVLDGFDSWKTHLFDFVDAFRSKREFALVEEGPVPELDARLRALSASATEALCHELRVVEPAWCSGIPSLSLPWFVTGIENLKASALVESTAWFRARNIFVLGNFLARA